MNKTVTDTSKLILAESQAELHSLAGQVAIAEKALQAAEDDEHRRDYKRIIARHKERISEIIAAFEAANEPITVRFPDGEYTVRPINMGDTIIGTTAHNAMYAMDRINGYKQREFAYRVNFLLNRMALSIKEI